jgi:gliding motility-associated-like protein
VLNTGKTKGVIELDWTASPSTDVNGYVIYRSTDNNNWTIINKMVIGLTYNDSNINTYRQSYYYRITPIDTCRNLGATFSVTHKSIQLTAVAGNQDVLLHWTKYLGWKILKYNIYRDGKIIGTANKDSIRFQDTLATCTNTYHYKVESVADSSVFIAALSNEDSARPVDHIAPDKVYIRSASVDVPGGRVIVSWDSVKAFDVKNYYIYRKTALDGRLILLDSTDKTFYYEDLSHIKGPDCYYVFAHDHCGNISAGSNRACLIILKGFNEKDKDNLSWNAYGDWPDGVKGYNIHRNEDLKGWTQIQAYNQPLNYTDIRLDNGVVDYCYQVEAVENPGGHNANAFSTVICLHQDPYVYVPDAFSPHTTLGINDSFGPKGMFIKNYTMDIFNRWGEQVFHTDQSGKWDGTFKGELAPENVYMYFIKVEGYNGTIYNYKGNLILLY